MGSPDLVANAAGVAFTVAIDLVPGREGVDSRLVLQRDTNWRRHFYAMPRICQPPRLLIDEEGTDRVAVLVGSDHHRPLGYNRKIAWPLTPGGFVTDEREPAGLFVDGEDREAVMPAIGPVKKPTIRCDVDIGRDIILGEIFR